jgi:predicted phosphodiesterase
MRWLCISDIHGDAQALGAVLATAERRGYDKLLVAGDLCFPGPEPLAVWRRLTQAKAVCVQGVGDRAIATIDPSAMKASSPREQERLDELARVRRELGDLVLERLLKLDTHVRLPLPDGREALLVHGSPADPTEPFTHDMTEAEMAALLGDDPADIVLCGGSHVPFDRYVAGVRVINVGSVGDAPSAGGPRHAEATVIEFSKGWSAVGGRRGRASSEDKALARRKMRQPEEAPGELVEQLVVPLEDPA